MGNILSIPHPKQGLGWSSAAVRKEGRGQGQREEATHRPSHSSADTEPKSRCTPRRQTLDLELQNQTPCSGGGERRKYDTQSEAKGCGDSGAAGRSLWTSITKNLNMIITTQTNKY